MNVADEMNEEAQRLGARLWRGSGIAKDTHFVGERARDAAIFCPRLPLPGTWGPLLGGTVFRDVGFSGGARNVDEVPGGGFGAHLANIVRPSRGVGEGIVVWPTVAGKSGIDWHGSKNA